MKITTTTKYSNLFEEREKVWFTRIQPWFFSKSDTVLKIGNGFGYLSEMIRTKVASLDIYEVSLYESTINKEKVTIYDGINLSLSPKSKDISIFNLVLHHIPDNQEFLKKVISITNKRIILVEETYDNIFQKIHLVWRDWYLNIRAGQPCDIHWNSYFKRNTLEKTMLELGLSVVHRETYKHHSYYKELIVLDIK